VEHLVWLKFCPKDWNGDVQLRSCSLAARGLWAALLEPMHFAEPYGHLLVDGKPPSADYLAVLASCKPREVDYCLKELIKQGVASVTEAGVVYSRRMVRDRIRHEKRKKDGKTGGHPLLIGGRPVAVDRRVNPPKARITEENDGSLYVEVNHGLSQGTADRLSPRGKSTETRDQSRTAPAAPSPAKDFLVWFQAEYKARRHGATYFVTWDKHMPIVGRLLKLHAPDRLKKHAQLLLTTDEPWTETTDRGIEVLAGKINWLDERLCQWEAKRKAREPV
jgi:hypothetical protein